MLRLFTRNTCSSSPPEGGFDIDTCRTLLNANLDYISRACEKAVAGPAQGGGQYFSGEGGHVYLVEQAGRLDKDELFIQVIDHLKEDDFRRLRNFRGNSSLTTYMTTIINRLLVDLVRQRTGRSRAKERSERHGDLGKKVYDLLMVQRHSVQETAEILAVNFGITVSIEQILEIRDEMQGRGGRHQSAEGTSTAWGKDGELIAVNPVTPETAAISDELSQKKRDMLARVLDTLTAEEKIVVRLRFPLDDKEPLSSEEIGQMLGKPGREIERQIRRILISCRELLLKQGISFEYLEPELSV